MKSIASAPCTLVPNSSVQLCVHHHLPLIPPPEYFGEERVISGDEERRSEEKEGDSDQEGEPPQESQSLPATKLSPDTSPRYICSAGFLSSVKMFAIANYLVERSE